MKTFVLPSSYDRSQIAYLWRGFRANYEWFFREFGGNRTSFAEHVLEQLLEPEHATLGERHRFVVAPGEQELVFESTPATTLVSFYRRTPADLHRVYVHTLHLVDAYLRVIGFDSPAVFRKGQSVTTTLGRATSLQYYDPREHLKHKPELPFDPLRRLNGLYVMDNPSVFVPGPRTTRTLLLWVRRVEGERHGVCRLVASPTELDFSHMARQGIDRSDWSEDHYVGIAVPAREGVTCHLASVVARASLFAFIRYDQGEDAHYLTASSYGTPGHLAKFERLISLKNHDISAYFDSLSWIL